jgi:fatty-acyl-CoA synthase
MQLTLSPEQRARLGEAPPFTVTEAVRARASDERIGLKFEDQEMTHRQVVDAATQRAQLLLDCRTEEPLHVGLLLDNVPDFTFWFAAVALAGGAVVPFNPTRRGTELAGDIAHMDCQLIVTEDRYQPLLQGLDLPITPDRILVGEDGGYAERLEQFAGAPLPDVDVLPADPFMYVFTSGSTGAPKACRVSHGRLMYNAKLVAAVHELIADDVLYEAMPFFHSSILMSCWASGWSVGACHAMRRRFSASNFLTDVRRYRATYFGYVGKPLAYVLATPERADDSDNPLRSGQGNEGSPTDIRRFEARFGCSLRDGYGSTEGCVTIARSAETPFGALGRPYSDATGVIDPDTLEECAVARFDEHGKLLNPDEAIGEIVDGAAAATFEGYYRNPEAEAARLRNGWYWSGDLGYRDAEGWIYFAGRNGDMIRVDGENLSTAIMERILEREQNVVAVAAYAVPADVGDDLAVCLQPASDAHFDPDTFVRFLDEQEDLGPKARPRYVRVTRAMPLSSSHKIDRRRLRTEGLATNDPIWVRSSDGRYVAARANDDD